MLRIRRDKLKLDTYIGKQMLVYGLPAALQMSIISISDMTLQAVVNTYGTTLVVAYGVCIKVEGLGMQVGDALGTALGTFTGQNTGAKNIERIKAGFRTTFLLSAIGYAVVSRYSKRISKVLYRNTFFNMRINVFFTCVDMLGIHPRKKPTCIPESANR